MRAAVLVALAGCFSPEPPPNQPCSDWCPPPESCIANTCQIDLGDLQPNYAFVTPTAIQLTSVTALDATCATLAMRNKLDGTFLAWISTSAEDMRRRFAGNPARGWIRPDGKPFADSLDDILAGRIYYPLRIAADGSDVADATVATGTRADGTFDQACNDLAVPLMGSITNGKADAGSESWTDRGANDCMLNLHIYCFGSDRSNAVSVKPAGHKQIFVTKNTYSQRLPAEADQLCNNDAGGGNKFAALLATTSRSVNERFAASTGPWARRDGLVVTEDMLSLLAPIELAFDGTRVRSQVWFGASTLGERATAVQNCGDWMSPSGDAKVGQSERSAGSLPFDSATSGCDPLTEQHHYYCAEL